MKIKPPIWVIAGSALLTACATPPAPPPPIAEVDPRQNNALVHEPQVVLERDLPGQQGLVVEVVPEDLFVVYGMWSEGLPDDEDLRPVQGSTSPITEDEEGHQ
jgi:hypothetical protein